MSTAVDHLELRYRRSDVVTAWTNLSFTAGTQSVDLTGTFERGQTYQVEARNVGVNGAASPWVTISHTVADTSILPLQPTLSTPVGRSGAIQLNWTISGVQRSDVQYQVQRTGDSSGAADESAWADLVTVASQAYLDATNNVSPYWYRVRAVDYSGLTTDWSNEGTGTAILVYGGPTGGGGGPIGGGGT